MEATQVWSTADLMDKFPKLQPLPFGLSSYGGLSQFSGPVCLVKCFEDNSCVKSLLNTSGLCSITGHKSILVVDGGSSLRCALMGDQIAEAAVANHWAGVVIAGAIRDSKHIKTLPIGVLALGTCPQKSIRLGAGQERLESIQLFGVTLNAQNWLYNDEDGALIAPHQLNLDIE